MAGLEPQARPLTHIPHRNRRKISGGLAPAGEAARVRHEGTLAPRGGYHSDRAAIVAATIAGRAFHARSRPTVFAAAVVTVTTPTATDSLASSLTERYVAAQLAGDRRAALALVDEGLDGGLSAAELQLEVVQPAQYEIGRLWQENRITVAQEHLATAISQLVLAHLYRHLPRDASNGKRVLVACVEGELHDMGARVAADHLEMAGYAVQYLGANVPTTDLVAMVRQHPPDLLALSASMPAHLPAVKDAVTRVCAATGNGVPIALGGRAFAGSEADYATAGTLVSCTNIEELIRSGSRPAALGGPTG